MSRIKYIYCTDTVLDREDQLTLDITKQSLDLKDESS
jgi:hypothetical protein